MVKKSKAGRHKNKPAGREMIEGDMKQGPDKDLVANKEDVVNDPSQGFLDPDPKPRSADGELKDAHYAEPKEGDRDDDDEAKNDEGDDSSQEEEEASSVQYFYENNDEKGKLVGCTFVNMSVHVSGDSAYALVGPTPATGGCVVCGSCDLFPADNAACGGKQVMRMTRAHVFEMSRGPNYQFMYAKACTVNEADSEGVVTTET
jgi:hypothetical protein